MRKRIHRTNPGSEPTQLDVCVTNILMLIDISPVCVLESQTRLNTNVFVVILICCGENIAKVTPFRCAILESQTGVITREMQTRKLMTTKMMTSYRIGTATA